ncbi:hypothetical protein DRF62_02185 [Chryseobacterium piscium]|uniref:Uncharacterized protein n=1 Tax=Chryseobacterium piscium TaxID=333702 RepID=A0A3D9BTZ1_9FLAO|nr:hypothetical protein [Chryseobacterium piscium]REC56989.1 hypothetical protein DRF62_02185 [Chryseobacterium piscium]
MDSKELRIGNFVSTSIDGTDIYIVEEIKMHGLFLSNQKSITDTGEVQYHNIYPIPLTADWLLKFEFIHLGIGFVSPDDLLFVCAGNNGKYEVFLYKEVEEDVYLIHCEQVHQLQNLYFALTGKELNLNN